MRGCGGYGINDFPNDFVVEDVQCVGEGFKEFAESSVCGGGRREVGMVVGWG